MFSKRDLKIHLSEISEEAAFTKFKFFSTEKFSIELKCRAPPEESSEHSRHVGEWVKKFSAFTATTWIVRNSFPNRKRMVFRKIFACQRSSFNKKTKLDDKARNVGCLAKLDFRVKFINKNTVKNDPHLKQGLNMTVTIDFTHSHKLWTERSFTLLRSTSEMDEMFCSYMSNGFMPTAAKQYHELVLLDRYGDNPECFMNANINPTTRHVHYLHEKLKKGNDDLNLNFEEIMAAKRSKLEDAGGFINYENPNAIVVVTPTMRRVISATCLDHILIDSSLANGIVVTFLYVPSKAGALPIASVLHSEQSETSYTQSFLAVKLAFDNICNGFEPKLLTIKEIKEIRDAANAIFPSSNVLTSKWSLCSNIWQWMFGDDVKIERKIRHSILELINKLIRANTLEEAEVYYSELKEEDCVKLSPVVNDYIDELWGKRDQWLCGDEVNYLKLAEVSIRLIDEFIQRKCKSFNVYAMVEVVINIMESQIRHILYAHANNSNIAATYTRFLNKSKTDNTDLKLIAPNEYKIESKTKPKKYVRFNIDNWCCDCAIGQKGRFCEHLCSIVNTVETDLMKQSELTDEEKCLLTEIAGAELEDAKLIKAELEDAKMELESDGGEMDDDGCDEEIDDTIGKEDMEESASSPKSETNDDRFYYLDVKAENCVGIDPLEETSMNDEINLTTDLYAIPSTSGTSSNKNLKNKYEDAMKALNNEFRRLNKYFKQNPNKANLETMLRLTRELKKIRPVERLDLSNMQITLNSNEDDTNS